MASSSDFQRLVRGRTTSNQIEPDFNAIRTPSGSTVQSITPSNARRFNRNFTVQKTKISKEDTFKELTKCEKCGIVMFNLCEPLLIAFIMATSIEVAEIGTSLYLLITLGVMTPCLLTSNLKLVKLKYYLAYALIGLPIFFIFLKMWLYVPFTHNLTNVQSNDKLLKALGVFNQYDSTKKQWSKTFLNDMVVFVFAIFLTIYYFYCVK